MRKRTFDVYRIVFFLIMLLIASCTRQTNQTFERPMGRGYHAMAYDTESKRVILYGGQTGNIADHPETFLSAETWAFDPIRNRWQKMSPESSPPAMSAQAMAYDSESDRVILHGGGGIFEKETYEDAVLNQTWAYDFNENTWMKMSDGPRRLGHRMAYDTESDRIVMFSGVNFQDGRFQDVQETWVYDFNNDTWTEMKPVLSPAPRLYYGMVYDKKSDKVLLWGGFLGKSTIDNNIWEYDFNSDSWMEREAENSPDPRCYHAMAYDDISGKFLIYGGTAEGNDEMWTYDLLGNTWTKLHPTSYPGTISRMPMVYSSDTGKLVLFGGQLDSRQFTYSDATWSYDLKTDTWTDVTIRHGAYLGQKRPRIIPETFAPQVISPERAVHGSVAISADGREIYWSTFFENPVHGVIMCSKWVKEGWTAPEPVSFSDSFDARNPFPSRDGVKLYFYGRRTAVENQSMQYKIWVSERRNETWKEPTPIDTAVNSGKWDAGPSVAQNGSLYFTSYRDDSQGMFDIYRARWENGRYRNVERLGNKINSDAWDLYPYVAPDESFLIFSSKREGGQGGQDLYISFSREDGEWLPAQNMGSVINSKGDDMFPFVTEDRRYLFFGRTNPDAEKTYWVDVYWLDAKIIAELRPRNEK